VFFPRLRSDQRKLALAHWKNGFLKEVLQRTAGKGTRTIYDF